MNTEQFANNARTTLNGAINNSVITIVVTSATDFPLTGNFRIIVDSEIMLVTAVSGANFTVSRGQEGTTAIGHSDGSPVNLILTEASIHAMQEHTCQGRLTLTSGTPVTVTDVTAATSIYFSPYTGNSISLYDGTNWIMCRFSEISIALGTLTSGKPYDLFAHQTNGVVAFDAPVAWTNGTTRATALVLQDGVLVKNGDNTRRYIGTFYTTSTTTTEDSIAKRFLWNYYNRIKRTLERIETVTSWISATNSVWQYANANSANKVEVVIGVDEDPLQMLVTSIASNQTGAASGNSAVGIGLDSSSALWSVCRIGWMFTAPATFSASSVGHAIGRTGIGYHFISWLETTQNTSDILFSGTRAASPGNIQWRSGLIGYSMG